MRSKKLKLKNELSLKKKRVRKKNQELIREHKYLREKLKKLQLEISKQSELEENSIKILTVKLRN